VDSQYDTTSVVAAYDGLADFPDRPSPLAILNALVGAAIVHTPTAFSTPDIVPPGNIVTTVNSRGAKETTYFVPNNGLPLTMPFRLLGAAPDVMDDIDATLKPMIDAGYSRNDNPATRPITVDPVRGLDPFDTFDASTRADVENFFSQFQNMTVAPPNVDGLVQQAQSMMPAMPALPALPEMPDFPALPRY
jgi:hypothetical protein